MGFTYDYYITEEEYEATVKNTRSNLLMRALVLSEEDAAVYGQYLKKLPEEKRNDLWYDTYVSDCADRRASACSVFQMTNSGFHAEIDLGKEDLVFFSVPYDDGFTAYVNGQETDILRVDEGLMAVLAPAGGEHHRLCLSGRRLLAGRQGLAGRAGGVCGIHGVFCLEEKETLLNPPLSIHILP